MKFGAIDIGANAVRLMLSKVTEDGDRPIFKKESFVRVPIRLGEDTFKQGRISEEKVEQLIETMIGYRHLMKAYVTQEFVAYATSALREAENRDEVCRRIKKHSGIDIAIIDGKTEAEVIYANHIEDMIGPEQNYVYVDVGGGSTELNAISRREVIASKSIKETTAHLRPLYGIGTGGNINKIFRLARIKEGRPISYSTIRRFYEYLSSFTLTERMAKLGLRADRADVIVLAAEIYLSVMKWAKIKKMYVPQMGLADGIIHILYDRFKAANATTAS